MRKNVLVIKLGTAVITKEDGQINRSVIKKIAQNVAALSTHYHVILVSSGAVGSGKSYLPGYKGTITERKAAAAIGNPLLIQLYHKYFSPYHITVAQALCERHHFANREQFLQLKETFSVFWKNNILPIVNENDLVSNSELKFSDNDELATRIAAGFDAHALLLCTSSGGLRDHDKNIIPEIPHFTRAVFGYVNKEKSSMGLGGMLSKLTYTRLAVSLGIRVVICGLDGASPLTDALEGKQGTSFSATHSTLRARQKWLAGDSVAIGSLYVDKGAAKALSQRKSLLTVGIKKIKGNFGADEVVRLVDEEENIIGVAKTKLTATDMNKLLTRKNMVAAHADDIVMY